MDFYGYIVQYYGSDVLYTRQAWIQVTNGIKMQVVYIISGDNCICNLTESPLFRLF